MQRVIISCITIIHSQFLPSTSDAGELDASYFFHFILICVLKAAILLKQLNNSLRTTFNIEREIKTTDVCGFAILFLSNQRKENQSFKVTPASASHQLSDKVSLHHDLQVFSSLSEQYHSFYTAQFF